MVNEDIVTALRNAINNGESLDSAVQIMINSGYDSKEVYEASQLVGSGVISNFGNLQSHIPQGSVFQQTSPDIHQSYPLSQMSPQQPTTFQPNQYQPQQTQIQQPARQTNTQANQQPKKAYIKGIILVIILIILLGILGASIFFRERILGFFS
ncbi:MAG: hypothetical protein AABW90_01680 [Nanoarchaeota archaeon]